MCPRCHDREDGDEDRQTRSPVDHGGGWRHSGEGERCKSRGARGDKSQPEQTRGPKAAQRLGDALWT
jgi:hypothetical protein